MRGRKPKPTAVKEFEGNPGKRPLNTSEPTPPANAPEMPEHLDTADGRKVWQWLCGMLDIMGLLAESDVALMTLYCDTWLEYLKVRRDVNRYGTILISKNTSMPFVSPYLNIESMLKKQLLKILSEIGFSPTARTRLGTTDEPAPDGVLEDLLRPYSSCRRN